MNYLGAVNLTLQKMREAQVASVTSTPYAQLIGRLVNETKTEVESSWMWSALRTSIVFSTTPTVFTYNLTGTNNRTLVREVFNRTSRWEVREKDQKGMTILFTLAQPQSGSPFYYTKNGQTDATGEILIDVYPVPQAAYILAVNLHQPQADLAADADIIKVPEHLVVLGAYAKALAERGDMETQIARAEAAYSHAVGTAIALDVDNHLGGVDWQPR